MEALKKQVQEELEEAIRFAEESPIRLPILSFRMFIPISLRRCVPDEKDELCRSHPGRHEYPDA